jgi:hypothetical protein
MTFRIGNMWLLDKDAPPLVRSGELLVIEANGRKHRYGSPSPAAIRSSIRFTDKARPISSPAIPRWGAPKPVWTAAGHRRGISSPCSI